LILYTFKDVASFNLGVVVNAGTGGPTYNGVPSGDASDARKKTGHGYVTFSGHGVITVKNSANLGNTLAANGFTLHAHMKLFAYSGENGIFGKNYGQDQFRFNILNNQLNFAVNSGTNSCGWMDVNYTPNFDFRNKWVMTAAVFEPLSTGTKMSIVFNEKIVASKVFPGCHGMAAGTVPIHIGNTNGFTSWAGFDGSMESVKIYTQAVYPSLR